jgi:hypothetical protein
MPSLLGTDIARKRLHRLHRLQYGAVMRNYQKITLEIEIAVLKDKDLTPEQLTLFIRRSKRGLKEALNMAKISHGGITIRGIVDKASLSEVNKIHKELTGK